MNILSAPLIELGRTFLRSASADANARNGGSIQGFYLGLGALLSLAIIAAGVYFILGGQQAAVELETPLGTLKTGGVGVAVVVIGSSLYLGIGKILMGGDGKA